MRKASLAALPQPLRGAVSAAAALARERRGHVFLVGGAVRDLFLRRPVKDVDLAVEGDAAELAAALAARLGARAVAHARFGTATLELPGGARVDLAATRRETYAYPGALPVVAVGSPGSLLASRRPCHPLKRSVSLIAPPLSWLLSALP